MRLIALPSAFYLYNLDRDPDDHKLRFYALSPKNEWILGRWLFNQMYLEETDYSDKAGSDKAKNDLLIHNTEAEQFLNELLQHILRTNDIPNANEWHAHVCDTQEVNAYAVPGGNIVFNMGILNIFDNVDQLAMVMAHETAHVTMRHSVGQASTSFLRVCSLLFCFVSFDFSLFYMWGFEWGGDFLKLRHSRQHEARADLKGLEYLKRAGFALAEGPKMILKFENLAHPESCFGHEVATMQKNENLEKVLEIFSDHPRHFARYMAMTEKVKEINDPQPTKTKQKWFWQSLPQEEKTMADFKRKFEKVKATATKYNSQRKAG